MCTFLCIHYLVDESPESVNPGLIVVSVSVGEQQAMHEFVVERVL